MSPRKELVSISEAGEVHFLLQVCHECPPPTRPTHHVHIKVDAVVEGEDEVHYVILEIVHNSSSCGFRSIHVIFHEQLAHAVPQHRCATAEKHQRHASDR